METLWTFGKRNNIADKWSHISFLFYLILISAYSDTANSNILPKVTLTENRK